MNERERDPGRWWSKDAAEARGRVMVDTAKAIESAPGEMERADLNLLYGSMYEGRPLQSLYQYGGAVAMSGGISGLVNAPEVTWNLTRSVVQTIASQVSRARPRARFVTTGGNYKQKRRAKKLTTFCDGLFAETDLYETTQQVFIDAGCFDIGAVQVFRDGDRLKAERVLACEILIDANSAIYGKPRTLYRRRFIDRDVAMARWGTTDELREKIAEAPSADPVFDGAHTNLIEVYEGWHLRSSRKAKDGYHAIGIDGIDEPLFEEEWTKDYFPIVLFRIDPALAGPYGVPAAATLLPIQVAVNTLLDKIARAQHLAAVPRVALQRGSKIKKSDITNGMGSIIEFSTVGPTFFTPTALSPEVYAHLERHFQRGFELYGVNRSFAAGMTDSGAAAIKVREDVEVQTARFAVLAQRWERLHLQIARIMVDMARDIYRDNKEMRVSAPGTALLESIDWSEVNLEEDAYVIQPYPTSILPTTPQGRIERVKELVADGIWTQQRAESALDDLDVDSAMSMERASEKDVERMCEGMLVDGRYEGPEPWMDLATCLRIASQYVSAGRIDGAPRKHIDLLYRFMDDVAEIKKTITPPPAPAPAAPAAMPMAA